MTTTAYTERSTAPHTSTRTTEHHVVSSHKNKCEQISKQEENNTHHTNTTQHNDAHTTNESTNTNIEYFNIDDQRTDSDEDDDTRKESEDTASIDQQKPKEVD